MLFQAKQDFAPLRVAERKARVTVDPTTIRELHESAVLAGIGKHDGDDSSDGASRPLDAGLSEPFVDNDLIGLPTKFQPRCMTPLESGRSAPDPAHSGRLRGKLL
jgi:hypothetical protein